MRISRPMADTEDLAFAAEFPPATREQWLKLVDGVLKGAPFDKRLVARTYDGLAIEPLYARAARRAAGRGARAGRAVEGHAARRSSRSGRRQRAGAARS